MKKLFVMMIALLVIAAPAFANMVVNGDFETGDETGWTRWDSTQNPDGGWGGGFSWGVEDGALVMSTPNGSFGVYQAISVIAGHTYEFNANIMGNGTLNWVETLFFNDDGRILYKQFDAPADSSIISKVDGWGMNGGMPFKSVDGSVDWGSVTDFYYPSGLHSNQIVATGDTMYVCLKTGSVSSTIAYFDNVSVEDVTPVTTPEPGSIVALLSGIAGLGGLVIRRRK